ncbi:ABC transporter permease [Chitinophaga pendula]|uniref:ABC transporter permease n=1 Tax=Chitinophaga TaxID=79328 RepID=UPI000BAF537C|nr:MULTISPECIES: ABC transporter permease [Chitinophaga]ASZ09760.1 hypothetical protein CK934_01590 [Chitinophaga sp. MD30]UCJ07300.1 ABC transporter permease [Chitinophaga pendula]
MYLIHTVRSELVKTRHSFTWWLTLLGAGIVPFVFFVASIIYWEKMIPAAGTNPWDRLFGNEWQSVSFLLLPMYIILAVSLSVQLEYNANAWKQLLAQPVPHWSIYFSKLILMLVMIVGCYILFSLFTLVGGAIAGVIHPELGFLRIRPNYEELFRTCYRSFLSVLGIVGIQYLFSLRWRNFVIPVGIGLAGVIASMILVGRWKYAHFVPYASPSLTLINIYKKVSGEVISKNELLSVLYFALLIPIGYCYFRRKEDK